MKPTSQEIDLRNLCYLAEANGFRVKEIKLTKEEWNLARRHVFLHGNTSDLIEVLSDRRQRIFYHWRVRILDRAA